MEAMQVMWAEVDEQGRLILPPEIAKQYGIQPGARLRVEQGKNDVRLHRPAAQLSKIYIEPTNICNLLCRTCMRNVWDEQPGRMDEATFTAIRDGIAELPEKPLVFLVAWASRFRTPRLSRWFPR